MLNSYYKELGAVMLPEYKGRNKYMHTFDLSNPRMADGFEDYLPVVADLCRKAGAFTGLAHMTVAEEIVEAGHSQRRPAPHIDGKYLHSVGKWGWIRCDRSHLYMPFITVSSAVGCQAWKGLFDATPRWDGDLSQLNLPKGETLAANTAYVVSSECVHESIPVKEKTKRIFLRILLPDGFPVQEGK